MQLQLTKQQVTNFQKKIYDYYHEFGRIFSWRNTINPYHIFVSEVMLQQTQTIRVEKKYEEFIKKFSDFETLANAPLREVLNMWQGLGYNRRAKFLHRSAQIIVKLYGGKIPNNTKKLQALPGIGKATAASICAFAFNTPTLFVETNIRVVFIHLFLSHKENICDTRLLDLVKQTLDGTNPRIWYYALTDYGAMLKSQGINPIDKSKTYHKQSKFEGSDRQIRGAIIRVLLTHKALDVKQIINQLAKPLGTDTKRVEKILHQLVSEKLVQQSEDLENYFLAD